MTSPVYKEIGLRVTSLVYKKRVRKRDKSRVKRDKVLQQYRTILLCLRRPFRDKYKLTYSVANYGSFEAALSDSH